MNGPTVNFNGNNSGNVAIGRDVTQTTNPVIPPVDAAEAAPLPCPAENIPTFVTTKSNATKAGNDTRFWAKLRAFVAGTSGVITLVSTVVIAVFTVLMWLIMSR